MCENFIAAHHDLNIFMMRMRARNISHHMFTKGYKNILMPCNIIKPNFKLLEWSGDMEGTNSKDGRTD